jgi:hypothetical protein
MFKEMNDLEAAEEWCRNCWKEQQRAAQIARLKSLFTLPHSIITSNFPEDSESASAFKVASGKWNQNQSLIGMRWSLVAPLWGQERAWR